MGFDNLGNIVLGLSLVIGVLSWDTVKQNLVQKYYAVKGVYNRHAPYDPSVWEEKDPEILLWKAGSLIGRSGSAVMGFFPLEAARCGLLCFVYFRVQDTWADICIGSQKRINGLKLLPKRLKRIQAGETDIPPDDSSDIKWDFASRDRNKCYVDVTLNVHRFDSIFLKLSEKHQRIAYRFANDMGEGWAELEERKDEKVSVDLMRRHAEVALDVGYLGLMDAVGNDDLANIVRNPVTKEDKDISDSYINYSDFIWYLNLAATIEEDIKEGVALDDELREMKEWDTELVEKVRLKWLVLGIEYVKKARVFLLHPDMCANFINRLFVLQFTKISGGVCYKHMPSPDPYVKKNAFKALAETLFESLTQEGYKKATEKSLQEMEDSLDYYYSIKKEE